MDCEHLYSFALLRYLCCVASDRSSPRARRLTPVNTFFTIHACLPAQSSRPTDRSTDDRFGPHGRNITPHCHHMHAPMPSIAAVSPQNLVSSHCPDGGGCGGVEVEIPLTSGPHLCGDQPSVFPPEKNTPLIMTEPRTNRPNKHCLLCERIANMEMPWADQFGPRAALEQAWRRTAVLQQQQLQTRYTHLDQPTDQLPPLYGLGWYAGVAAAAGCCYTTARSRCGMRRAGRDCLPDGTSAGEMLVRSRRGRGWVAERYVTGIDGFSYHHSTLDVDGCCSRCKTAGGA